jgi:predicted nicotinamide N-methyase
LNAITMDAAGRAAFVLANTRLRPVPLAPEIVLHIADEAVPLWQKTEDDLAAVGLPPPFWAFAWAGGQALARHVLDDPGLVRSKSVLDLGAGSGLVAIAAAKAGARLVLACDLDLFALAAMGCNAAANDVAFLPSGADMLDGRPCDAEVILVGDLFYERDLALRVVAFLDVQRARGADVVIGDPGRSYLPKDRLVAVGDYAVPVTRDLEDAEIKRTRVWRFA